MPGPYLLAFSRWMWVRARFTEDIVEQAAAGGIGQYVILGAGLDWFRAPLGTTAGDGLRVFEVDHPATQLWKRRRLAELGVEPPARRVFAPVDFEAADRRDRRASPRPRAAGSPSPPAGT